MSDFFVYKYINILKIMTEQERKDHDEWYDYYFGYSHLTPERKCRRGALTIESKR